MKKLVLVFVMLLTIVLAMCIEIVKVDEGISDKQTIVVIQAVKYYLSEVLLDPSSVIYNEFALFYNKEEYLVVRCKYRAKNRYGGYGINDDYYMLKLENNKVIEFLTYDNYLQVLLKLRTERQVNNDSYERE